MGGMGRTRTGGPAIPHRTLRPVILAEMQALAQFTERGFLLRHIPQPVPGASNTWKPARAPIIVRIREHHFANDLPQAAPRIGDITYRLAGRTSSSTAQRAASRAC